MEDFERFALPRERQNARFRLTGFQIGKHLVLSQPNGGRQVDRPAEREGANRCYYLCHRVRVGISERSVDRPRGSDIDINYWRRERQSDKSLLLHSTLGHIFAELQQYLPTQTQPTQVRLAVWSLSVCVTGTSDLPDFICSPTSVQAYHTRDRRNLPQAPDRRKPTRRCAAPVRRFRLGGSRRSRPRCSTGKRPPESAAVDYR